MLLQDARGARWSAWGLGRIISSTLGPRTDMGRTAERPLRPDAGRGSPVHLRQVSLHSRRPAENIALLTIGASFLTLSPKESNVGLPPLCIAEKCWVRNRDLLFCLGFGGLPVFTPSERVEVLRLHSALRATSPLYSQGTFQPL